MLEFQHITLADREWAESLLKLADFRGSEYTFSNNYIYRKIYNIRIARMNDYYIVRSARTPEQLSYLYPAGSGDVKPVIEAMMADAAAEGQPFDLHGVPKESIAVLETLFPGQFAFEETRENFDYLYESERLMTLAGKKLHSKRNFINRFQLDHEGAWAYEEITQANIDDCWAMSVKWCKESGCGEDPGLQEEFCAVRNCFNDFWALGLSGGLLRLEGEVVAYTMGRPLNSDTFIVHIEKAFSSVAGAYPMINQQFVTHRCAGFRYINREDDVGEEGLRKAKLSYKPDILLEKFHAVLK